MDGFDWSGITTAIQAGLTTAGPVVVTVFGTLLVIGVVMHLIKRAAHS